MAIPTLAPNSTWFSQGGTSVKRASITEINIVDSYTPTGSETASWDASAAKDGGVMCYVNGTVLTIAGNGSGKIYANEDSSWVFSDSAKTDYYSNLTVINGGNLLDTGNATTIARVFQGASALTTVDVGRWDTAKVMDMTAVFQYANAVNGIDVSKWNVSNVTLMSGTFNGCSSLTSLDVGSWDVSNVTAMNIMFQNTPSLKYLDVSKWNTAQCTTMRTMFKNCAVETLDVSGWNTERVTTMYGMFNVASHLRELDLSNWVVGENTDTSHMFDFVDRLQKISFGENFSFAGGAVLNPPKAEYISGADGNWYDSDRNAYAPAAIPSNTARTYYASLELVDKALNGVSRGKTYLIHRMFGKPFAHALTGKWHWAD
jgi:surface protein